MDLSFLLITARSVVIACDVQGIQNRTGDPVGLLSVGCLVHAGAYHGGHEVEHGGVHAGGGLLLLFICPAAAVLIIDTLAGCGPGDDHQIDAAGNGSSGVLRMEMSDHLLCQVHALLRGGLADLIADGVHDDRGVVIVPADQLCHVFLPVVHEVSGIVIQGLVVVPHIPGLVHDIEAQLVAGFQKRSGGRIMADAEGVEAGFLEDPGPSVFALVIAGSSQNALVVVDTAAPEQGLLSVNVKSLRGPGDQADAEGYGLLIHYGPVLYKGYLRPVKIRVLVGPE